MRRSRKKAKFTLFAFQDIVTGLCGVLILFVLVMLVDMIAWRDGEASPPPQDTPLSTVDRNTLRQEIAELNAELAKLRELARLAVVAAKDGVAPEAEERLKREISDAQLEIAAIVSQIEALKTKVKAAKEADAKSRKAILEMEQTRRLLEERMASLKGRKGITLIPERGETKIPVYVICGKGGLEVLKASKPGAKPFRKQISGGDLMIELERVLLELDHTTHTVIVLVRPSGIGLMRYAAEKAKSLGFACGRDPLEEDVEVDAGFAEDGK